MDIACSGDLSREPLSSSILVGTDEPSEDEGLSVVVSPAACAEFRDNAAGLEQTHTFLVRAVFLTIIVPVCIHKAEVGLGGQRKHGDLVEDRVDPCALDLN